MTVKTKKALSEKSFWNKIKKGAAKMGEEVAVTGIKTWLAMVDSKTPKSAKIILGSALAYLVMPIDAIPDALVGVGFTDDMAALGLAAKSVGDAITDDHDKEARDKWSNL